MPGKGADLETDPHWRTTTSQLDFEAEPECARKSTTVTITADTSPSYTTRTRSNNNSTIKLRQSSEAARRAVCWYSWSLSPLSQLHSVSGHLVPMTLRRPAACLSTTPYLTVDPNNSTKRRETQLLEPALTSSCVPAAYNRSTLPTILPNPSRSPPPSALQPVQPKQSRLTATTLQRISLDSSTGAI